MKRKLMIPEGTRDYLQEDTYIQRQIITELLDEFLQWGYHEIKTPMIEKWDIVRKKHKDETNFFTLVDKTGDLLVLRPEITAPMARVVATHFRELDNYPLRLAYAGEIFSQGSLKSGERRQQAQVGIELIGSDSIISDCEVLIMALDSMKKRGVKDYSLGISHMDITVGLLKELVEDEDLREKIEELMINKDLVALDKILPDKAKEMLLTLVSINGSIEFLKKIKDFSSSLKYVEAIERLETIYGILKELGYSQDIFFDFSILGDFDYYTGLLFEGFGPGVGTPIISGGRYDNLIHEYHSGKPAVGFAINVDLYVKTMDRKITLPDIAEEIVDADFVSRFKKAELSRAAGNIAVIDLEDK